MKEYILKLLFKLFYKEIYRGVYNTYYRNRITGDLRIKPTYFL